MKPRNNFILILSSMFLLFTATYCPTEEDLWMEKPTVKFINSSADSIRVASSIYSKDTLAMKDLFGLNTRFERIYADIPPGEYHVFRYTDEYIYQDSRFVFLVLKTEIMKQYTKEEIINDTIIDDYMSFSPEVMRTEKFEVEYSGPVDN